MAREYAKTNFAIWQDPDWRTLPWPAQYLYRVLWDHPDLSYCGVVDWRPGRLRSVAGALSSDTFHDMAACLAARHFIVVDTTSEEVLLRSWIRFDGLMKQPVMAASMAKAFAATASNQIRGVIVDELVKLNARDPGLGGWKKPQVQEILTLPRVRAKDLPVPVDPFHDVRDLRFAPPAAPPAAPATAPPAAPPAGGSEPIEAAPSGAPPTAHPPYNSNNNNNPPASQEGGVGGTKSGTSSEPSLPERGAERSSGGGDGSKTGRKRPAIPIPDDWKPNDKHAELASTRRLDLAMEAERFRDHAEANDRRQASWDASFRQWLNSPYAQPVADRPGQVHQLPPHASELELPPDGLTPEQYAQWEYEQRMKRKQA